MPRQRRQQTTQNLAQRLAPRLLRIEEAAEYLSASVWFRAFSDLEQQDSFSPSRAAVRD